ncbi:MAG: hypothetical protein IRY85_02675 [Micromonosporaceae bacterium]|nr:hypothetical protein [Micromonosporaceae bacterium]
MIIIVALVVVGALVVALRRRAAPRGGGADLPSRVVAIAARWLPAHRREWGRAMIGELSAIHDGAARWRLAGAAIRVAILPPTRHSGTSATLAGTGLAGTAVATLATERFLPALGVFVAALGLLLTACASVLAGRWRSLPAGRAARVAGAVAGGGLLAATCAVVLVATTDPRATLDPTHVASLALAATLCGYAVAGLATVRSTGTPATGHWVAVAGAAVAASTGTAWDIHRLHGAIPLVSPAAAIVTAAAAIVVTAVTGSRAAGRRAGLLSALLGAPVQFAATLLVLRGAVPPATLADSLAGDIVRLAVTPLAMYVIAAVSAVVVRPRTELGRPLYQ